MGLSAGSPWLTAEHCDGRIAPGLGLRLDSLGEQVLTRRVAGGQATLKSHSRSSPEDHGTPADDSWWSIARIIGFEREALATPKHFSPRICRDAWLAVGTGVLSRNAIESTKPYYLAANRARDAPLGTLPSRRALRRHHHSRIMSRSYAQEVSFMPLRNAPASSLSMQADSHSPGRAGYYLAFFAELRTPFTCEALTCRDSGRRCATRRSHSGHFSGSDVATPNQSTFNHCAYAPMSIIGTVAVL
jgi:hypothetical protein